ncbi:MAG: DUF3349 domain-containing protein [Nocardiaceae bacterium]|nr:DUF3349 domain-containing protein [Nocardiaceae bacterium]
MGNENVLTQVLGWLRVGYPDGVPPKDYFPLLALLRKSLTQDDVDRVISQLLAARPNEVTKDHIHEVITRVKQSEPHSDELYLVAAKLVAGGWPLSGFGSSY